MSRTTLPGRSGSKLLGVTALVVVLNGYRPAATVGHAIRNPRFKPWKPWEMTMTAEPFSDMTMAQLLRSN
jgi:hypothetical protein